MATAAVLIAEAFGLAGNSSLSTSDGLAWLNRFLDAEYRRKYPWQRVTVSIAFASGVAVNTAQWNTAFLDFYEHADGSVGRWSDAQGNITSCKGLTYRQYINIVDRLTSTGPPAKIAADLVGLSWYVYPKTDQAYTVSVDIYTLPAALTATSQTPTWSTYAPDQILVQALKVAALEYQDDARYATELQRLAGQVGGYRRRLLAEEGVLHQTALDQRVFLPVTAWD